MIPEDFSLRRHYLTEQKFKQEKLFEQFIAVATSESVEEHVDTSVVTVPLAPESLSLTTVGLALTFVILLVVLF